ncbi:MAG: oxidoreductase, partial [Duganella sp.]
NAAHDFHYREELEAWQRDGLLQCDIAWSRDGDPRRYVQDLLPANAERLRNWVEQGAAIYVCGSLEGMAAGVDLALEQILGRDCLEELKTAQRYQRDVY